MERLQTVDPGGTESRETVSEPRRARGSVGKRALDVAASTLALALAAPLLVLIAALLRRRVDGPLLGSETRMGRGCRPFRLLRFRLGPARPEGAQGIPAPGRAGLADILVRLGLDRLPELLNVLRGDLSLVGPRPERPEVVERHRGEFEEILRVRPGLIDPAWARRRDARDVAAPESFPDSDADPQYLHVAVPGRIRVEREYVRRFSAGLDLSIIAQALGAILTRSLGRPAGAALAWAVRLSVPHRRVLVVLAQAILVALSTYCAFLLRFEGQIPERQLSVFWSALPLLLGLRMAAFLPFGLFEGLWRYVSVRDARNIAGSIALSSLLFVAVDRYIPALEGFPRSVVLIDALLLGFLLSSIRLSKRVLRGLKTLPAAETRALIVGAGDAGEALVREIEMHREHGYVPVGFIDDDRLKRGTRIRGVRVLGTRKDLERVLERHPVDAILVAIPSASPEMLQEIVAGCRRFGLPVKTLPSIGDLLLSRGLLENIRDVEPEDLLFRAPVTEASPELEAFYRGKVVLVTGAGGSIGSELVRQLARFRPSELVLVERHEYSLYQIEREIRREHPGVSCTPVIGDIVDRARMAQVLGDHKPRLLFHAAAYKHVPMMERNPHEAVKVNILGTKNMIELSRELGVERFVFISSDKAVDPSSVMGGTKRVGELMIQDASRNGCVHPAGNGNGAGGAAENGDGAFGGEAGGNGAASDGTRFMAVRFGNVLESSGSVVPLFKEQIRRGGPVTVTHPDVERYFMTTAEAVHLVLHAAVLGKGGEIFVLDMGRPIKLLDMAKQLISLYGYEPGKDIEIVFTGLRPGEKMTEGLFNHGEEVRLTRHPKVRVAVTRRAPVARCSRLPPSTALRRGRIEEVERQRRTPRTCARPAHGSEVIVDPVSARAPHA